LSTSKRSSSKVNRYSGREKNRSDSRTKSDIKREFDEFAERISELESLRNELNSLDADGFESDVKEINSKLKDVNAIPEIKRELNSLREKIRARGLRYGGYRSSDYNSFDEDQQLMKSKIAELEAELHRNSETDFINIPELDVALDGLKREIKESFDSQLKRRMEEEKKRLILSLARGDAKRMHDEKRRIVENLEGQYIQREESLRKRYEDEEAKQKAEIKKQRDLIIKEKDNADFRFEALMKKAREISYDDEDLRHRFEKEKDAVLKDKKKLEKEIERMNKEERQISLDCKRRLNKELLAHDRVNGKRFRAQVSTLKREMHNELIKKVNSIEKEKEKVRKSLLEREALLRKRLEREHKLMTRRIKLIKSKHLRKHLHRKKHKHGKRKHRKHRR